MPFKSMDSSQYLEQKRSAHIASVQNARSVTDKFTRTTFVSYAYLTPSKRNARLPVGIPRDK